MRPLLLGPVLVGLSACGDPVTSTAYKGELLLEAGGRININEPEALSVLERPLRAGLFWAPDGLYDLEADDLKESLSGPLQDFVPSPFFVRVHEPLPVSHRLAGSDLGVGRLLVYSEIESLGVKGFLNQLLPQVFKHGAWGVLHMLLEIFSYR